jgi:Raf kinase inhibitor-like YbhB/YbcL family protein
MRREKLGSPAPTRRAAPVLLAAVLVVAGCGSGSDNSPAAGDALTPAPSMPTPAVAPTSSIKVSADAFSDGGVIPQDYTCTGAGKRPVVSWTGVPSAARSTALAVTDPDAPSGEYLHWLVTDLPGTSSGRIDPGPVASPAKEEKNGAGSVGWKAPCPPKGTGIHHYHFTLFALSDATPAGDAKSILAALRQQAIARGELVGIAEAK